MPRKPIKKKRTLLPDPVYGSVSIHMLVNRVMKSGKKTVAYRIVYNALKEVGETLSKSDNKTNSGSNPVLNPVEVFETVLINLTPRVEVKPRRRAGAVQMVPRVLTDSDRGRAIALRWLLEASNKKSGQSMVSKLKSEILDAYKKTGAAMRKREELHKIAINNAMYSKKPQTIINAVNEANV